MPVQNAEIAALFDQAAELLEIKGDNPFRCRAYCRAARLIEGLPKSVTSLLKAGEDLSELPGIGKDLAGKIAAIVTTGKFDLLESLKHELPGDLGEIAALPVLGPKRVKLLYDKLGVRSIEDLHRAAKAGRLCELRGFGPKSEAKLLAALTKPPSEKRFKLAMAEAKAEALVSFLRPGLDKARVVVAGSYRRRRDTVGDLDILVTARRNAAGRTSNAAAAKTSPSAYDHNKPQANAIAESHRLALCALARDRRNLQRNGSNSTAAAPCVYGVAKRFN